MDFLHSLLYKSGEKKEQIRYSSFQQNLLVVGIFFMLFSFPFLLLLIFVLYFFFSIEMQQEAEAA